MNLRKMIELFEERIKDVPPLSEAEVRAAIDHSWRMLIELHAPKRPEMTLMREIALTHLLLHSQQVEIQKAILRR